MSSDPDRLRLARAEGVGPVTYRRLMNRFETAAEALDALPALARAGGRQTSPKIPTRAEMARESDLVAAMGGRILCLGEADYPRLLARLEDAPAAITVLGDCAALSRRAVAVVGSRNASANGRKIAEEMARDLAQAGLVVVSGLARGIDTAAHLGALEAGVTAACIAGGIDVAYPPENAKLQARIAAEGVLVAEAPLGTSPQARHFPRRNRVIAGLSLGVVVVEAALRSGSLITARMAVETDREVFAVPGSPLDARCRGTNDLLRQGAHLTETATDVLEALRLGLGQTDLFAPDSGLAEPVRAFDPGQVANDPPGSHIRETVLGLLGPAPTQVDDLIRRCQFSAAAVMSALLEMEIAGRVEALPGNRVALLL